MFNSSSVPSFVHGAIAGYVTFALVDGAKTEPRRRLGRSFVFFTAYCVAIGVGYSTPPSLRGYFLVACLFFGLLSVIEFAEFARGLVFEARHRALGAWAGRMLGVLGAGVLGVSFWFTAHGEPERFSIGLTALIGVAFLGTLVLLVLGAVRRIALSRRFLLALPFPFAPVLMDLAWNLGVHSGAFHYLRNLALLLFCFAALSAYMDHAEEPISLRRRVVAAALTTVLAVVSTASEIATSSVGVAASADAEAYVDRMAVSFLSLGAVATLVVLVAFPLLLRATVFRPLDGLANAARGVEAGRDVRVEVRTSDELGTVASAFNMMVDAQARQRVELEDKVESLERTNAEVAALNAELRRQIVARSRQLQESLAQGAPHVAPLAKGELVGGRYRVLRELGGGGMGVVFEVEDELERRARLALKVVANTTSRDDMVRFAREAEIAATVDHPNVVRVTDVGVHGPAPFLVMALISGGSLEAARARFGDVGWGCSIVADIAAGLGALHARGIVHRDLKPANVLLDGVAGRAKITDFGIARSDVDALGATSSPSASAPPLTGTGVMIGTLPYMAPEGARGVRELSGKADVFALGLIGYEVFTGRSAFALPPILEALAGRPLPELPPLPAALGPPRRAILERCLALAPEARPTPEEVAEAFGPGARLP
jgi:HAMP domain-containing protein